MVSPVASPWLADGHLARWSPVRGIPAACPSCKGTCPTRLGPVSKYSHSGFQRVGVGHISAPNGYGSYSREPSPSESFIPSVPVRHSKATTLASSWPDTSASPFLVLREPQADKVFANQNSLLVLSLQLLTHSSGCWAWSLFSERRNCLCLPWGTEVIAVGPGLRGAAARFLTCFGNQYTDAFGDFG